MSDAQGENRHWTLYVRDMLGFGERVLLYTDGLDRETFEADGLTYDATLRNIQLIGKTAANIPGEVRERCPDVPWREIIGTRNRLAHSYLHISNIVIWSIIEDAIPNLLPQLRLLLDDVAREGAVTPYAESS